MTQARYGRARDLAADRFIAYSRGSGCEAQTKRVGRFTGSTDNSVKSPMCVAELASHDAGLVIGYKTNNAQFQLTHSVILALAE